jgi:glycosyltransferase involved in cell wall biosynthesis
VTNGGARGVRGPRAEDPASRIGLIGPVQPFRGGIAQYTTQLHRALTRQADLLTLSFRRMYPAWLFPGQGERDPDYAGHREPGVEYLIDPYDLRTWLRAAERLRAHGATQVVIPWWTAYWSPCFSVIARRLRRFGIRVTFLCHNVQDHEDTWLNALAAHLALRAGNDYLVHCERQRGRLLGLYDCAPVQVHPHPVYDQFPAARGVLPRRAGLELLFYGFVRPYKGVDVLLQAVAALPERDLFLTIAGEVWGGSLDLAAAVQAAGLAERVELRPRYHTEQESAELFARADAVVLPYRDASASGVVALAYHYDRPVIVTRVGGLPDVVEAGASGFIVPPDDPAALAQAICAARGFVPDPEALARLKGRMSWPSLAAALIAAPVSV